MTSEREKPSWLGSEIRIMLRTACATLAGIAVIEIATLPRGPALILSLAFIVIFAGLLLLRKARHLSRPALIVDAAVQTALAVGLMLLGSSWMLGGVLFFILCASLVYELPLSFVYLWNGIAFLSILACSMIARKGFDWGVLPFCVGISSVSAMSVLLRRAREAREESLRLLGELEAAQSRLRELAVLEERQRLAGDIHDAVGYRLTASSMLLESAARFVRADPDRAVRLIETSRDQVREGLAELRTAVHALREDGGKSLPLAEVLGALVDVFSHSSRAKVSLRVGAGLPEPDTDRKLVIVRAAQEALTNAQKHSGASRIELGLGFADGAYELECRDDGRGPGPEATEPGSGSASLCGFGLGNLRSRAADFGGSVRLLPAERGGALLRLRLPAGTEAKSGS